MQQLSRQRLCLFRFHRPFGKQRRQLLAQCRARAASHGHQVVYRIVAGGARGLFGVAGKEFCFARGLQIKHFVANRDTAARRVTVDTKYAQRQVLDRKNAVAVGAGNPAFALGVVGFVELNGHSVNRTFHK